MEREELGAGTSARATPGSQSHWQAGASSRDRHCCTSPSPPDAFSHPGHEAVTEAGESSLLLLPKAAKGQGTEGSWLLPQPHCLGPLASGLAHLGNGLLPGQPGGWQALPPTPRVSQCPHSAQGRELSSPASPGLQPGGTDCRRSACPSSRSCL